MHGGDIDWSSVKRVLVVRLRSIGDTVLTTPSLIALRRFLPNAQIDMLLESWVAPVLDGFDAVDNVRTVGEGTAGRIQTAWDLRRRRYDAAINLHGGTTATLLTAATGARYRLGLSHYQYSFLHNRQYPSTKLFWGRDAVHSAEQQLALLGFAGVPVQDGPKSRLAVTAEAMDAVNAMMAGLDTVRRSYALLHPATAFFTKRWATENFARTAEFLAGIGLAAVAVTSKSETQVLEALKRESKVPIAAFDDLSLPEITAMASKASLFVGNDSGIAHIAAAVGTPSVVIFGSSNRAHWRPWTDAPNEIVFEELPCQPCTGYVCEVFGEPKCILSVRPEQVFEGIRRVLESAKKADTRPALHK